MADSIIVVCPKCKSRGKKSLVFPGSVWCYCRPGGVLMLPERPAEVRHG